MSHDKIATIAGDRKMSGRKAQPGASETLALPRETTNLSKFNGLSRHLGRRRLIVRQSVSEQTPKPSRTSKRAVMSSSKKLAPIEFPEFSCSSIKFMRVYRHRFWGKTGAVALGDVELFRG